MENKEIKIVKELLPAFDSKNFDLDAWKIKASLVLKKIFGEDDEKVKLINQLHYNYSSWSLRDNSGGRQHDPVKDKAREIVESAVLELELIGEQPAVMKIMQNQLTGNEFDQLQVLIKNEEGKETGLTEYFSKIPPSKKDQILTQIMLKLSE